MILYINDIIYEIVYDILYDLFCLNELGLLHVGQEQLLISADEEAFLRRESGI